MPSQTGAATYAASTPLWSMFLQTALCAHHACDTAVAVGGMAKTSYCPKQIYKTIFRSTTLIVMVKWAP